jgi:hypothetical protein
LLTAAFVAFFHFTFIEAVALTKVLNMFSSLVATLVFAKEGRGSNEAPKGSNHADVLLVRSIQAQCSNPSSY